MYWIFVAILFLLFLIFNIFLFPRTFRSMGADDVKPLDLMFGYDKNNVENLFEKLGESGRKKYVKDLWTLDFIYPMIYTALLSLLFRKLVPYFENFEWLFYLPFVIMFLDYIENSNTSYLIKRYPKISENWVRFASIVTQLKWIFAGINVLILIILIIIFLFK